MDFNTSQMLSMQGISVVRHGSVDQPAAEQRPSLNTPTSQDNAPNLAAQLGFNTLHFFA